MNFQKRNKKIHTNKKKIKSQVSIEIREQKYKIQSHLIKMQRNNSKPVLFPHIEQFHQSSFYYHLRFVSFPALQHAVTIKIK